MGGPRNPEMDEVFRALADPSRRALLDRLDERNGQTLRELCAGLDMARQSVSKHLAVLEAAQLVTTRRRGREKHHFLNAAPINAIADRWIHRYDRERARALADLTNALERRTMTTDTGATTTRSGTTDAGATNADRGDAGATDAAETFSYTTYIRTTPEELWRALTDPAFTRRYWGVALESDFAPGSPIVWRYRGATMDDPRQRVLAADPPRHLSMTWHAITESFRAEVGGDPAELDAMAAEPLSEVSFDIEPMGDVVKLSVLHRAPTPRSRVLAGVAGGWPMVLASLKTLVETGQPLDLPD